MKNKMSPRILLSAFLLAAFAVWTCVVRFVEVKPVGPNGSSVGLATLNSSFHSLTGVNFTLYNITDWLGVLPALVVMSFALLGLAQWLKRKKLSRVDANVFILGGFYVAVMAVFVFFENVVVNYRPVLIGGILEASYPSSITLLVMCVMPTALMQLNARIKNVFIRRFVCVAIVAFTVFMVLARLISGVHWFTDIIGGVLLSASLVSAYSAAVLWAGNRFSKRLQ